MQNERKRILQLVENGIISAEEAITLLEALSNQQESTQPAMPANQQLEKTQQQQQTQQNESVFEEIPKEEQRKSTGFEDLFGRAFNQDTNKKIDEFMNDLKVDLSQFSTRMTGLMNTTFSKLKDMDIDFPFGEKVEFAKTYAFPATDVNAFDIEIPNGKVTVVQSADDTVQVETQVKTSSIGTEEETITRFTEDFVTLKDGKLSIATESKFAQVKLRLAIPAQHFDVMIARLFNGNISFEGLDVKLLKAKTYNGSVKLNEVAFSHAEVQSSNGAIEAYRVTGDDFEAETVIGRIYIDGALKEVEAESVNGNVAVTTTSDEARKVKARTVAGSVELYVPKTVAIDGQVSSNFGKTDVALSDVVLHDEEDQFLLKTVHFDKSLPDAKLLKVVGESRTGTVIVRYSSYE